MNLKSSKNYASKDKFICCYKWVRYVNTVRISYKFKFRNAQDAAKVKKSYESSILLIRFLFLLTNSLVNAFLLFMLLLLPLAQLSVMSYSGVLSQSIYTRNGTMHFLIPGMSLMLDSSDELILTSNLASAAELHLPMCLR